MASIQVDNVSEKINSPKSMKFDIMLRRVGEFGRYQRRVYVLVCLITSYLGMSSILLIYQTVNLPHRCDPSELDHKDRRNGSEFQFGQCHILGGNNTTIACERWLYEKAPMDSSVISQFNLVCNDKIWRSTLRMFNYIGQLIGCFVGGLAGDIYGRKKVVIAATLIAATSRAVNVLSPEPLVYGFFILISAAGNIACFIAAFHLGMELVGVSKRFHAGTILEYFFSVGLMITSGLAYLVRDWKHLTLAGTLSGLAVVICWWILPESPRWLISKDRAEEAQSIIHKMYRVNRVLEDEICAVDKDEVSVTSGLRVWHLLTRRRLLCRFSVTSVNWVVIAFAYHGITMNIGDLSGNLFLNMFLAAICEFIGIGICHVFVNKFGRKYLYVVCMLINGVCCICAIFPNLYLSADYYWIVIVLVLLGKLMATSAYSVLYIHTAELIPTAVRVNGVSFSSLLGRFGGIVAPYIVDIKYFVLSDFGEVLPLLIIGLATMASGALYLVVPETLGKPLPETLDDSCDLKRNTTVIKDYEVKNIIDFGDLLKNEDASRLTL